MIFEDFKFSSCRFHIPNRTMSSSSASTSAMVRLIFCTEIATPALIEIRLATLAFKLMSACRLSTSSSIRPTDKLGTFRTTSRGPPDDAAEEPLPAPLPLGTGLPVKVEEGNRGVTDTEVVGKAEDAVGGVVELP